MNDEDRTTLFVIDRLRIFQVRGHSVMLDSDLAAVYAVQTKVLNQAISRNAARFPDDFLFRLTRGEWTALRSQNVTLKAAGRGEHRKYPSNQKRCSLPES
jgi:ORF6N domain